MAEISKKRKAENTAVISEHKSILTPAGVQLSDSVTVLRRHDLEISGHIPDTLDAVYGMDHVKQLLQDCIELPILGPQHYRLVLQDSSQSATAMGKRDLEHTIAIYGQRSSGKLLLVSVFCAVHSLTLIIVNYAGFDPARDIKLAYEYAENNGPCVIVFDECEGSFHPGAPREDYNIGILQNWLDKVERSNAALWTIFVCSVIPDLTHLSFAIHKFVKHSVWCHELNDADREKCFRAAINRYLYDGQNCPLSDPDIAAYVSMSKHCTAGDIFKFVRSVFLYRIKQVKLDLAVMSQTDDALVPTVHDFALLIIRPGGGGVGRDRITEYDPTTYNIAPYTNNINMVHEEQSYGF